MEIIKLEIRSGSIIGIYPQYIRISENKIEQRILLFTINYECNYQSLANEISREFNLTFEQAMAEIYSVQGKYPNIV